MFGFYHYIIITLPYKSYLLSKHLKWMQWSLLCSFIVLQSDTRSLPDMMKRFYCCLHQLIYHNRDIFNDDHDDDDDDENINLLIDEQTNNNTSNCNYNPDIHDRNSNQCIKMQVEFIDLSEKENGSI